jgi:uncharacterized protein (TIGR02453 family)
VSAPEAFGGFPRAAFEWFAGLERDNSKRWFEAHRETYDRNVRGQLESMLEELTADFDGRVKMFRQHRDIRFSKDKSPYKTATYGLIIDRPGSDAGLYAQLTAAGLFAGSGYHTFSPDQLDRYRERAAGRAGANLERILDELAGEAFTLIGDELKTVPRGYDRDHPRARVLRRRAVAAGRRLRAARGRGISRDRALAHVRTTWQRLGPMNAWLDRNVGAAEVESGR